MTDQKPPRRRVDRAQEYIDSPLMSHRVRFKDRLYVLIDGNYGIYRTEYTPDRGSGYCTCPSMEDPCKHVRALAITWEINPNSFFDLESLLPRLLRRSKAQLVDLIITIGLCDLPNLYHLDVPGCEPLDAEDLDSEWDD